MGTWQLGLKRPDRYAALGPTAGPVDTIEFANSPWPHFVRLEPLTPWQETTLHMVDAIDYAANAGMVPVVAAHGGQGPVLRFAPPHGEGVPSTKGSRSSAWSIAARVTA